MPSSDAFTGSSEGVKRGSRRGHSLEERRLGRWRTKMSCVANECLSRSVFHPRSYAVKVVGISLVQQLGGAVSGASGKFLSIFGDGSVRRLVGQGPHHISVRA